LPPNAVSGHTASPALEHHLQFSIHHDFDAPVDAIEQALMQPDLAQLMGDGLASLESVEVAEHRLDDDEFHRVWRFQAKAPLPILAGYRVTRDMLGWEEHSRYRRREHCADWYVLPSGDARPDAPWRRYFHSEGRYRLDALADDRCRRTVEGDLDVRLKLIGGLIERVALGELRKAYRAEADAIETLCTRPADRQDGESQS
jgi:hypothetical protein